MELLYKAKLRLGIISIEERMEKYYDLEKSISLSNHNISILARENNQMKAIAEKNLQQISSKNGSMDEMEKDYLTKAINDKYNKYFSRYLDDVKSEKDNLDKVKKDQNNLFKGDTAIYLNRIRKEEDLSRHENYKYKDFVDSGLSRSRESMPQIDAENLDKFLMHFANKAKVTKGKMKLNEMKPSQKDFNNQKILGMYKNQNYKSHKYIVSKDGYMMDGHHNWAAGLEDDPNYEVDIYRVNLPIKSLLRRANMLTISTKRDINDKELKKSLITIVKAYERGQITEEDFAIVKKQITKGGLYSDYIDIIKDAISSDEKEVRKINRKVLNPDDGKPQKASKEYVMYNDESPTTTGKEYCDNCGLFNTKDSTCQIVKGEPGEIKAKGWCTLWGIDTLFKQEKVSEISKAEKPEITETKVEDKKDKLPSIEEQLQKAKKEEDGVEYKNLTHVAEKHKLPINALRKQLDMGVEVEMKKIDDEDKATEIALNHLMEKPNYYSELKKKANGKK